MLATSDRAGFAKRNLWNIRPGLAGSVQLDARELNHLGPLLSFFGDELAKIGRRPENTVPPRLTSRALIVGSARPALISRLSLSTISAGVFFGTPMPKKTLTSK